MPNHRKGLHEQYGLWWIPYNCYGKCFKYGAIVQCEEWYVKNKTSEYTKRLKSKGFIERCLICNMRYQGRGSHPRGEAHPNWKGGTRIRDGYKVLLIYPDNPYYETAAKRGIIGEHRYVMAQHLGRNLNSNEIVHHRDGNRLNNDISNLELTRRGQQHETSYTDGVAYGMLLMLMMLSVPLSRRGDGDI